MDLEAAKQFGFAGLMLIAMVIVIKAWIASQERVEGGKRSVELERVKVEDKKADAMAAALTSLSGKVDAHHTADIQSHQEIATEVAGIHGKLDQAIADRTPVRGVPQVDPAGYYGPHRPSKPGGGR